MPKIVITGPESTGKSTLAKALATYYKTIYVEEYARTYLTKLGRDYVQQDLLEITKGQIALEGSAATKNPKLLIYDTSLEVIKIWSEYKYGNCNQFIIDQYQSRLPDLYLLMAPDLPWQPDPLRENPNDREELYELYKNELISSKTPYHEISGSENERIKIGIKVIENKL